MPYPSRQRTLSGVRPTCKRALDMEGDDLARDECPICLVEFEQTAHTVVYAAQPVVAQTSLARRSAQRIPRNVTDVDRCRIAAYRGYACMHIICYECIVTMDRCGRRVCPICESPRLDPRMRDVDVNVCAQLIKALTSWWSRLRRADHTNPMHWAFAKADPPPID
jgi:hypothetical protein